MIKDKRKKRTKRIYAREGWWESPLHLEPYYFAKSNHNMDKTEKFIPDLNPREDEVECVPLYQQLVPHFEKLNLNLYSPGSSSKLYNGHSENILKIMLGEGNRDDYEHNPGKSPSICEASPAPPSQQDNTYTMDAFWADLGVEAPPQTPSRRRSQIFCTSDRESDWEDI